MDLKEKGWEVVNWIKLAPVRIHSQDLVGMILNLCIPSNARNVLTEAATISVSRRAEVSGAGSSRVTRGAQPLLSLMTSHGAYCQRIWGAASPTA
jgi:hypothetical protein